MGSECSQYPLPFSLSLLGGHRAECPQLSTSGQLSPRTIETFLERRGHMVSGAGPEQLAVSG